MATEHALDGALGHLASLVALACAAGASAALADRRSFGRAAAGFAVMAVGLHLVHATLTFTDRFDLAAVREVVAGTAWARSVGVFATGAMLAALAAGSRGRACRGVRWGGVAMGVVGLAWLGHGAGDGEVSSRAALHVAHIGAAVVWAGGLVAFAWAFASGARPTAELRGFARVAAGCVALLAVTGAVLAVRYVPTGAALASPYGAALAFKLAFVLVALVAAARNRARLGGASAEALAAGLEAEVAAVCLALALAAVLAQVEPPA